MVRRVIIDIDRDRRLLAYPQGGFDLEYRVDGIGWVLDNDADVSYDMLLPYLESARDQLAWIVGNIAGCIEETRKAQTESCHA